MPLLFVLLSYLLGTFPSAYLAGYLSQAGDIRLIGDRNMGAQNAYRCLGRGWGITVFIFDLTKGALAIMLALTAGLSPGWVMACGLAAVLGHNWPVWLGFRGGRGEATAIGVMLLIATQPMLLMGGLGLLVLVITSSVITASAVMFGLLWLAVIVYGLPGEVVAYSIGLPVVVGLTHYIRSRQTRFQTK
ncbi:glycerol-3-phosphate acyltransferase [Dehalococcoides mccartyi]|uniref:Glycerol-3-phosphate acyltransferase n=1 Tax=Dehalococcoides mccartyi (strain VS) TaxID=311424 RepID=D2BJ33_DEHMV|nr:glycerol-3-phosphate acyltransferase [Dehalococcoides mccartyi]ACZ62333.1 hypothetical protein DhcVS_1226 [Dehalococcoides mccartyi VS]